MKKTMGWKHENGRSFEDQSELRDERFGKERDSAEAIAAQLRELGVEADVVVQTDGVIVNLHRYLHLDFRYRVSSMVLQPCDGVALRSSTPDRYGLRKVVRNYKLNWDAAVPALINPDRVASAIRTVLESISTAEATRVARAAEQESFSGLLRDSVSEAGFQVDTSMGSGVVYLTAESDIRSKARAPAFQVHLAVTEDKNAHMLLKCRMPPEKVGVLAAKLNELVLEHELRLM